MKNKEWSAEELKNKLEAYCAAAERCETEARMRLRQWHADAETEDIIITHLLEDNFISDERYSKAFAHDKLLYQGWGRVKIEYMLRNKRIALETIQNAIKGIDESEYLQVLNHLIDQRITNLKPEEQERALAGQFPDTFIPFFIQRGFTLSEMKQAVNSRNNETD